jgi:hypothetical protein
MGGATAICAMSALHPHVGDQILNLFRSRQKLRMACAYANDGVTSRCRSLVEGVQKKILQFELFVPVYLPQTAPLRDLALDKLLL